MNYKERMDEAKKHGHCFSGTADIYKECENTCDIMKRLSHALNHYSDGVGKFTQYGYMYEIYEEALVKVASIISKKLEYDFCLDENEVFESISNLYLNSSAEDNEFKGDFYE